MSALAPAACPAAYTEADLDVLARTIWGEARGEGRAGQEAVAAVILNRVRLAEERGGWWWGRSVAEVCRRPWQFSCWNENDPNRAKVEAVTPANQSFACCREVARRALAGELADPTGGATHYHAKSILPPWARRRTPSAVIGRHLFYVNVE